MAWILPGGLETFTFQPNQALPPPPVEQHRRRRSVRPVRLLLALLGRVAPGAKQSMQKALIRSLYYALSAWNRDDTTTFMNYGYAPLEDSDAATVVGDEENRYSIQLYSHVSSAVDLRDNDVLEVGCGRGGGSFFLKDSLHARSVTGIDLAGAAIKFCAARYGIDGLSFQQGDAENLPFHASSFDVVVNIESSHNYPSVERFFAEVARVLRPGGYFLFADLRPRGEVDLVRQQLERTGFTVLVQEFITPNVVRALELDSQRRERLIQRNIPAFLHPLSREFVGMKGSLVYEALRTGGQEYVHLVLRKPNDESHPGKDDAARCTSR